MHVKQQAQRNIKLKKLGYHDETKRKNVWDKTHSRYLNNQVSCTKRKHYDYKTVIAGLAPSRKIEQNRIPTEYRDHKGRNTRLEKAPWLSTSPHKDERVGRRGGAAACDIHGKDKTHIMHATIWSENQTPTKHLQCVGYSYECLRVCERIHMARSTNQQQSLVSKVMALHVREREREREREKKKKKKKKKKRRKRRRRRFSCPFKWLW